MRVLFIVKRNENYGCHSYVRRNSGLWNSTKFIADALIGKHDTHVVEVTDNNDIDREVTAFQPHVVIIEALWVVPEKFDVLMELHPNVRWFCHLHSNIPFLAGEGVAISWIQDYIDRGVDIIANSQHAQQAIRTLVGCDEAVRFCPNVYSGEIHRPKAKPSGSHINIGCFGAIRPMKNQLIQAIAALEYARSAGKFLRFHINGFRVEHGAEVLRNLQALFSCGDAQLIEHPWYDHDVFMHVLRHEIDLGMQVSLSETFNIVTADYVAAGLPCVVSPEIDWISCWNQAPCEDALAIAAVIKNVWHRRLLTRWNQHLLRKYSADSLEHWLRFLRNL